MSIKSKGYLARGMNNELPPLAVWLITPVLLLLAAYAVAFRRTPTLLSYSRSHQPIRYWFLTVIMVSVAVGWTYLSIRLAINAVPF